MAPYPSNGTAAARASVGRRVCWDWREDIVVVERAETGWMTDSEKKAMSTLSVFSRGKVR